MSPWGRVFAIFLIFGIFFFVLGGSILLDTGNRIVGMGPDYPKYRVGIGMWLLVIAFVLFSLFAYRYKKMGRFLVFQG